MGIMELLRPPSNQPIKYKSELNDAVLNETRGTCLGQLSPARVWGPIALIGDIHANVLMLRVQLERSPESTALNSSCSHQKVCMACNHHPFC